MITNYFRQIRLIALFICLAALPTKADETRLDIRVDHAAIILQDFIALPEQGIPQALLQRATAIAVVPSVLKVGAGLGARYGRGILLTRDSNAHWQAPTFITLASASVGWQLGAQSQDLILVFTNNDALQKIRRAGLTLGADIALAAGPLGRGTSAGANMSFDAPVYSYARTRGLFAGAALDGLVMKPEYRSNARFYQEPSVTIESVARLSVDKIPTSAQRLLARLNPARTTPTDATASVKGSQSETPSVRTFGLGERPLEQND